MEYQGFILRLSKHTGISFTNKISETTAVNHYTFENIYHGGGVGVGDLNNDGLPDLYFSGNQVPDRIYVNKGGLRFEDVTLTAIDTLLSYEGWHTGVSMADVDGDGWLDIYVCRSGVSKDADIRRNLLFMNNGDMTFREEGAKWGVDDTTHSMQAAFLDYDLDGDLDMYLLNTQTNIQGQNTSTAAITEITKSGKFESDRFFRNEGNRFEDVTQEVGIGTFGFGLGIGVGDVNEDGYPDIYVSNDYEEPDLLYINDGKGKFRDEIQAQIKHISNFSMGNDIADFNNDGYLDIISLDMAYEDHVRSKRNMEAMSSEKFWGMVKAGWHHQYMTNTLQMNNGNGTFSEVAQLCGVAKTDWSWAPLFADLDNDGHKDLFVTNGYKREVRDRDFQTELVELAALRDGKISLEEMLAMLPDTVILNYLYHNKGGLKFENKTLDWGLNQAVNSNGAAYADLDGDGDLDLVVNNMEAPAFVYENQGGKYGYLRFKLEGNKPNAFGIGTKVRLYDEQGKLLQYQEMSMCRGFQSSVEAVLHFGVGEMKEIARVEVDWPNGKQSVLQHVKANQLLTVKQSEATEKGGRKLITAEIMREVTTDIGLKHKHEENVYDDFAKEILLPHKQSQHGPFMSSGDVNGDGFEDFFIGGPMGKAGTLYMQNETGAFEPKLQAAFDKDKGHEDLGSVMVDYDKDGDLDLYVVSGGNEVEPTSDLLQDRLYVNDGKGNFMRDVKALPKMLTSGQCVVAGDYDGDGDEDLFIGGRVVPGQYPFPARSYLLANENGVFTDVTEQSCVDLLAPGLVTEALFSDYDGDKDLDLLLTGEWMSVRVFKNEANGFTEVTQAVGLNYSQGWWFSIIEGDFDEDGDMDYICGNLGKNTKYKASKEQPLNVYCSDFDNSGTLDIVLTTYQEDKHYPVRGRECTSQQMPFVQEKFPTYKAFAEAEVEDIYTEDALAKALNYKAYTLSSSFIRNDGGKFSVHPLPLEAQVSPITSMMVMDLNQDGHLDVLAAGNMYGAEVETIRYDAGIGVCLLGDGKGRFSAQTAVKSGFFAPKDVKDFAMVKQGKGHGVYLMVSNNSDYLQVFQVAEGFLVAGK